MKIKIHKVSVTYTRCLVGNGLTVLLWNHVGYSELCFPFLTFLTYEVLTAVLFVLDDLI